MNFIIGVVAGAKLTNNYRWIRRLTLELGGTVKAMRVAIVGNFGSGKSTLANVPVKLQISSVGAAQVSIGGRTEQRPKLSSCVGGRVLFTRRRPSYRAHQALFESYAGPKQHLQSALGAVLRCRCPGEPHAADAAAAPMLKMLAALEVMAGVTNPAATPGQKIIYIVNTRGWHVTKITPKSQKPGSAFTIGLFLC